MTRRERVLAAIAHREPDRVPVDLGGMRSTGISAIACAALKRHLGHGADPVRVYDVVQQLALPDQHILDFAGSDVIDLGRAWLTEPSDWTPWTLPDGSPAFLPSYARFEPHEGGWIVRAADGTVIGEMAAGAFYLSQTPIPASRLERRSGPSQPLARAHDQGHLVGPAHGALPQAPHAGAPGRHPGQGPPAL